MEIYYQGTNIEGIVQVNKFIVRDTAAGRCDSLELEFGNAAGWYSWGPEEDDKIIVAHDGYDSGVMYVNRIMPEDGKYRIFAASLPCSAREKKYQSFIWKTIEDIMRSCAASSGMDFRIYGIDPKTVIPYIERDNEGCAAFLDRLLMLESAVLKCVNGRYAAIGIKYAQDLNPAQTIRLNASQEGIRYRRDGMMYRALTIKTPYAIGTAKDGIVGSSHNVLRINDLPALTYIDAARWARGMLLNLNRKSESVTMQSTFNPGMTALIRVDIEGDTDATGEWLVEEVKHDLIELSTSVTMRRCNYSIS